MAMDPPSFGIADTTMWFAPKIRLTPALVNWCTAFVAEFFEHIDSVVWHRLGYPGNPLAGDLR
jgi:hypothetical protein